MKLGPSKRSRIMTLKYLMLNNNLGALLRLKLDLGFAGTEYLTRRLGSHVLLPRGGCRFILGPVRSRRSRRLLQRLANCSAAPACEPRRARGGPPGALPPRYTSTHPDRSLASHFQGQRPLPQQELARQQRNLGFAHNHGHGSAHQPHIFHYTFICSKKTFTFPPHPVESSRQFRRQSLGVQHVGDQPDVVVTLLGRHRITRTCNAGWLLLSASSVQYQNSPSVNPSTLTISKL